MGKKRVFGQKGLALCENPRLASRGGVACNDPLARDALACRVKNEDAVADADRLHQIMGDEERAEPRLGRSRNHQILHPPLQCDSQALEFGFSRKTRSPNLYERYTWSSMAMAASMTNWFGDLHGWVGNMDLRPETANTLALSYEWHDPGQDDWHLKASAQYSRIDDYITGEQIGTASMGRRAIFRFVNHDAEMFSLNLEGAKALGEWHGDWSLSGQLSYTRGKDRTTGENLYNIMPLNAKIALGHRAGNWTNAIELEAAAGKTRLADDRMEAATGGYGLVHLRSSYQTGAVQVDFAVENLFDRDYALPLGGMDRAKFRDGANGSEALVHGQGRSVSLGVSYKF